jgi:mannose-6-phosphate isomerase
MSPENWVRSTTRLFAQNETRLNVLPDRPFVRDAVVADPAEWVSAEYVARWGARRSPRLDEQHQQ